MVQCEGHIMELKCCLICQKEFIRKPGTLSEKQWRLRRYCSLLCAGVAKKLRRVSKVCVWCGKEFFVPKHLNYRKFCSVDCKIARDSQTGSKHKDWKGGRTIDEKGYVRLRNRSQLSLYEYEHRKVLEEVLGRKLGKKEVVHHVDGNRLNNDIDNLRIMDRAEHTRFHLAGYKR